MSQTTAVANTINDPRLTNLRNWDELVQATRQMEDRYSIRRNPTLRTNYYSNNREDEYRAWVEEKVREDEYKVWAKEKVATTASTPISEIESKLRKLGYGNLRFDDMGKVPMVSGDTLKEIFLMALESYAETILGKKEPIVVAELETKSNKEEKLNKPIGSDKYGEILSHKPIPPVAWPFNRSDNRPMSIRDTYRISQEEIDTRRVRAARGGLESWEGYITPTGRHDDFAELYRDIIGGRYPDGLISNRRNWETLAALTADPVMAPAAAIAAMQTT
jgi:hypothetical protein